MMAAELAPLGPLELCRPPVGALTDDYTQFTLSELGWFMIHAKYGVADAYERACFEISRDRLFVLNGR